MTSKNSPRMVGLGFLGIGLALLALTTFMGVHAVKETRIGRGLVETGTEASAFLVSAERLERSQCDRSRRFLCTLSVNYIGSVVYQVSGLRWGTDIRLTEAEYEAQVAGEEVFIDIIYLPSDPPQVERTRGARLFAAQRSSTSIYVMAGFGLLFTAIGGAVTLVLRKLGRAPSTGPGR